MKTRPTPSQLKMARNAFAPLQVMTVVPLECPPLKIIGVPPTKKPDSPNEPVPLIELRAA
jgi:hypothetical protein